MTPRFTAYRNEGGADFVAWAEAYPAAALRRYQVRDTGAPKGPQVTNTSADEELVAYEILVAYPQNARYGPGNTLDRDAAMRTDQLELERQLGPLGAANFTAPYPDACLRKLEVKRRKGNGVDFLAIAAVYSYVLYADPVAPVDAVTNLPTTAVALRDRARELVAAIAPALLASIRFIEFRNEGAGDFREWARANPVAAFRRWQLRDTGEDSQPTMQNTDLEARELTLELVVAYPQDARAGVGNALSRDDLAKSDEVLVKRAISVQGYANFTGPDNPNGTCIGFDVARELDQGVDFVVVTLQLAYRRAL